MALAQRKENAPLVDREVPGTNLILFGLKKLNLFENVPGKSENECNEPWGQVFCLEGGDIIVIIWFFWR